MGLPCSIHIAIFLCLSNEGEMHLSKKKNSLVIALYMVYMPDCLWCELWHAYQYHELKSGHTWLWYVYHISTRVDCKLLMNEIELW